MKIKKQITLLTFMIIFIPIFAFFAIPFYCFGNSPYRYIIKDFAPIAEKIYNQSLKSGENIENIQIDTNINNTNIEILLFADNKILFSTMPEFSAGTKISSEDLFNFMNQTCEKYKYKIQCPPKYSDQSKKPPYTIITRIEIEKTKITGMFKVPLYIPILIVFILIESIVIVTAVILSKNFKKSIDELESTTDSIAKGNLSKPIVSNLKHKNEITNVTENLENVRLSLKDMESRKTRFIMGMSHDLRTPVAIIKGYTEALADGIVSKPEKIQETHQLILAKISQLDLMITELINSVRLDNGLLQPNIRPQDFHEFLVACGKNISNYASIYKKVFSYKIDLPESYIIDFDNLLCERLIENLISNSVRYSGDFAEISLNAKLQEDGTIVITEEDNGIGMTEEDMKNIFDLFYRGTNSRREAGMGVGLNVVKSIIEIHGWQIDVESQKGKGSKFIITIPPQKQKKK